MSAPLYPLQYEGLVPDALREDLGRAGDLTTDAIVPTDRRARGLIVFRREGRVAGLDVALAAFRELDPQARIHILVPEGNDATAGETVAVVDSLARPPVGRARRPQLPGSPRRHRHRHPRRRPQHRRHHRQGRLHPKDHPGSTRPREVRGPCGRRQQSSLRARRRRPRQGQPPCPRRRSGRGRGAGAGPRRPHGQGPPGQHDPAHAPRGRGPRAWAAILEASGGITPETARAVAETGVDMISLGWLTHSVRSQDVALDIEAEPAVA